MHALILAALLLELAGCAPRPALWTRPAATPQAFAEDRYACIREAMVPYSGAAVGPYFGRSAAGMQANDMVFTACMQARGWTLTIR